MKTVDEVVKELALALTAHARLSVRNAPIFLRVLRERGLGEALEAGQAMRDYLGPHVTCIGYPDCDGDLVGEEHSEKCVAARKPSRTDKWDAAWAKLSARRGT
jgi:hypothetical protein